MTSPRGVGNSGTAVFSAAPAEGPVPSSPDHGRPLSVPARPTTVCLVACDVSADQNAARLAAVIRARAPHVRIVGVGGHHQEAAGIPLLLRTTHLSFTGVFGALARLRSLRAAYRAGLRRIESIRPDLTVIIDAEVAGCPFALSLRRRGLPVAFYFPPPVWLWGAWRARFIGSLARRVISAFHDEAAIYERAGVDTVWVGHPLRDVVRKGGDRETAMRAVGLDPRRPLVVLMPGSRRNEIARLLPPFLGAARLLQARDADLQFALPIANGSLRAQIEAGSRDHGLRALALYAPTSYDVLGAAEAVLQSSGTATLEAALLGVPAVVAYRLALVEYLAARCAMRVPFIALPNLILGERVVPEFFQRHVDADSLAAATWSILTDAGRRAAMRDRLAALPALLGPSGALDRAAAAILEMLVPVTESPGVEEATLLSPVT